MARRVYTPAALELIRLMAEHGCTAAAIAEKIGSTPSSVRVMCCRLGIKLRGRHQLQNGHPAAEPNEQPPTEQLVIASLPSRCYSKLHDKAVHLNKSVPLLARKLLEAIVASDLYEAVLDEGAPTGR
jgi:hypothetical protein